MAERRQPIDTQNPLTNPAAPVPDSPQPPAAPPERDPELEDLLESYYSPETETPDETPVPEPAGPPAAAAHPPAVPEPPAPTSSQQAPPAPAPGPPAAAETPQGESEEQLRQRVMRELLARLEAQKEPQPPEPPPPEPPREITPQELYQQYQPRIQQYVEAGWLDDDFVALYPRQAALMVHMWDMGTTLQQQGRQLTDDWQTRQQREQAEQADRQIEAALEQVVSRGQVFEAMRDAEVRNGFKKFLVDELNPVLSQATNPDFLARQFYAYNQNLITDLMRQVQGTGQAAQPSPAALAQQEGAGVRVPAQAPPQEEWADMIDGMLR